MLDDPSAPPIHQTSFPSSQPNSYPNPQRPSNAGIFPRHVTLHDSTTILPFTSQALATLPSSLLSHLCSQLNHEIARGDTYPMTTTFTPEAFGAYWFSNFAAVMVLGSVESLQDLAKSEGEEIDWEKFCLGTFYIKANYPGRSSHVCNAGFLVCDTWRGRRVGMALGEAYLDYAPKLGYTYSVFNLVYVTNTASCKIWESLGFERIGRVKGAGNLKSHPGRLIDAIIYGRNLVPNPVENPGAMPPAGS